MGAGGLQASNRENVGTYLIFAGLVFRVYRTGASSWGHWNNSNWRDIWWEKNQRWRGAKLDTESKNLWSKAEGLWTGYGLDHFAWLGAVSSDLGYPNQFSGIRRRFCRGC